MPGHTRAAHPADDPLPRPLAALLRPFESVWLGIVLLTLLLIYLSVGSALPFVRESRLFEMTEFEWFNWWPFGLLGGLLAVNLTVVTLRRIPFNLVKLGVWMIHTGIVLLIVTSWWYFAAKVEGDAPVIRRMVEARAPSGETARFPALPGASASAGGYTFRVANLDPNWPILSGDHEGEEAFSVSVMVEPPGEINGGERFIRQMLAGYGQYTEDVLPGRGRAVKETGEKLVDGDLEMNLALAPQEWYHLAQTRAVYVREVGGGDWTELPVDGLPRYNDYADAPQRDLWPAPGDPLPPAGGIDVPVPGFEQAAGAPARATGFVRYAILQERLVPAGADAGPGAIIRVTGPEGQENIISLAPDLEDYRASSNGAMAAVRIETAADLEALLDRATPVVRLAAAGAEETVRVERTSVEDPALGYAPLGDSGFSYRVRMVADGLRMPNGGELSAVIMELRSPEGDEFVRLVSAGGGLVQDIDSREDGATERETVDERLAVEYEPGQTPAAVTLVLGPEDEASLLIAPTGSAPALVPAPRGEDVPLPAGGTARVLRLYENARADVRPAVVPRRQRDRSAGEHFSMLELEIAGERKWLPFHEYVFDGPAYRYPGRFKHEPTTFTLPGGREIEVLYSRERERLPAAVALEDFHLESHVGGFTGATPTIRDWISDVRFRSDDGWTEPRAVATNSPVTHEGLSFFQARWDPPARTENGTSGGFAFTGLGVGSRDGAMAMLASSCLSVAGMIYVFYIKPSIQRSRAKRALTANAERPAASEQEMKPSTHAAEEDKPVEVGV